MESKKKIVILGSTGSIGKSALDVYTKHIAKEPSISIIGLGCYSNTELIKEQAALVDASNIAIINPDNALDCDYNVFEGKESYFRLIDDLEPDLVLNAVAGCAGLIYTKKAVEKGIDVAIANKESLIMGGSLILDLAKEKGSNLIPVDSEHSAIYQLLYGRGDISNISNFYITGSGGPFLNRPSDKFKDITKEEALNHPKWSMGAKITIDSATLMNKGLEVLEAHYLFGLDKDNIKVIIHPESIIHGMIEMVDGTFFSQMAVPDMKGPIAYALFGEDRMNSLMEKIDFFKLGKLTFLEPDLSRFPLLKLAYDVIGSPSRIIAMNSANEVCVNRFLNNQIKFLDIFSDVKSAVEKIGDKKLSSLDDVIELDSEVRKMML